MKLLTFLIEATLCQNTFEACFDCEAVYKNGLIEGNMDCFTGTDVNSTFVDDDQFNCYTEVEELTLGDGSTVYRIDRGAKEIGSYQERLTIVTPDCDEGPCPRFHEAISNANCSFQSLESDSKKSTNDKIKGLFGKVKPFLSQLTLSTDECPVCTIDNDEPVNDDLIDSCFMGNTTETDTCDSEEFCGISYTYSVEIESAYRYNYCEMDRSCMNSIDKGASYSASILENNGGCTTTNCNNAKWTPWEVSSSYSQKNMANWVLLSASTLISLTNV